MHLIPGYRWVPSNCGVEVNNGVLLFLLSKSYHGRRQVPHVAPVMSWLMSLVYVPFSSPFNIKWLELGSAFQCAFRTEQKTWRVRPEFFRFLPHLSLIIFFVHPVCNNSLLISVQEMGGTAVTLTWRSFGCGSHLKWLRALQGKILEGIYRLMSLTSSFFHSPCSCGPRLPPLLAHRLPLCEEEPREVVLGPPTHCVHIQYRNLSTEEAGRQRQVLFIYL